MKVARRTTLLSGLAIGAVALVLGFAAHAQAEPVPVLTDVGTAQIRNNGYRDDYGVFGYEFVVGGSADLSLTSLGAWDGPNGTTGSIGDGMEVDAPVGIWLDGDPNALATVTVPIGTSAELRDEFRYMSISPITLTRGNTYVLGSQFTTGGNAFRNLTPAQGAWDSHVTLPSSRYIMYATSLAYPSSRYDPIRGFIGPNAEFNVIPEPNALLLTALGGLMLPILVRRRRS